MRSNLIVVSAALFAIYVAVMTPTVHADSPLVKLVSPGDEPRDVVRYSVAPEQEQVLFLTIDKAIEDAVDDRSASFTEAPTTVLSVRSIIKRVRADGGFEYDFTIQNADLENEESADKNMQQVARQAMNALAGVSGSVSTTACGVVKDLSFNLAAKADTGTQRLLQQLRQVFNQIHVALPEEPVGEGAIWTVTQQLQENGKTLDESCEVTLVSRDSDVLQLDVRIQSKAKQQPVRWAKLAKTTQITLLSYIGSGRIDTSIDLKLAYPMSADINLQSREATGIKAESLDIKTRTNVSMKIRMQTTDVKVPEEEKHGEEPSVE